MSRNQKDKSSIDLSQKAAIESKINSVVSAGAGSGKTFVLSQRYLDLIVNRGLKVDQILTLTFTKKATSEMYERIYKFLKSHNPKLVEDFYKANISTLDSYCSSIVRMASNLYGIQPDFSIDEDLLNQKITELAVPFFIRNKNHPAIQSILNVKRINEAAKELFVNPILENSTIAHPLDFTGSLQKQVKEILPKWEQVVLDAETYRQNVWDAYNLMATRSQNFIELMKKKENIKFDNPPKVDLQYLEKGDYSQIIKFAADVLAFASFNGKLTKDQNFKEAMNEFSSKVSSKIAGIVNFITGYKKFQSLIPLLEEFQNTINDFKHSNGVLTYGDVSDLAVTILKEHPEIRAIEKSKYKAFLIDEFQDNNSLQRDLLFMLSEKLDRNAEGIPEVSELCPDKLFFVGDEKQSIYRFRGADVTVFRGLKNCFPEGNLELQTNYRSEPSLIAAFNTFFGGFEYNFAQDQEPSNISGFFNISNQKLAPDYEAVYTKVTIPKNKLNQPKNKKISKAVHINLLNSSLVNSSLEPEGNKAEYLTPHENEIYFVAQKIKEMVGTKRFVYDRDSDSYIQDVYKYSDFAILERSYSKQPVYERILMQQGIPFNTEVVKGFYTDGPINDITSYLKLILYPEDNYSYTEILHSPFVGLTQNEIEKISSVYSSPFSEEHEKLIDSTNLQKFLNARSFYKDMVEFSKTSPITGILQKLYVETGYRYELIWNQNVKMQEKSFEILFDMARKADANGMGIADFIDAVNLYNNEDEKMEDADIPLDQTEGVHLLTIHKSKGLEYPVVFIVNSTNHGRSDTNSDPYIYVSSEFGATLNIKGCPELDNSKSNYFFEIAKEENSRKELAEIRRVAYVALTRAIDEIFITGIYDGEFKNTDAMLPDCKTPAANTIFKVLQPVITKYLNLDENTNEFIEKEDAPFTFKEIPRVKRTDALATAVSTRPNTLAAKLKLIDDVKEFYQNADVEKNVKEISPYISPSKMHDQDDETIAETQPQKIAVNKTEKYWEINDIVARSIPKGENKKPLFGFNHFGTIAHAYLEGVIKNKPAEFSVDQLAGLKNKESDKNTVLKIAQEIAENFTKTPLGIRAINSQWKKAEFDFKFSVGQKIVNGQIDLVFKNSDGTYTIVDYKTNRTIEPEIYYLQLACYRLALSEMLQIPPKQINCKLYYLRFSEEVDITEQCSLINLEEEIAKQVKKELEL